MSGLTQERFSEMPKGESSSWLEGISELTKSEGNTVSGSTSRELKDALDI